MGTDLFSRGYNFMNTMANPKQYLQMNPTGVVLMIVLFSFGILFSNWITPTNTFPGTNPMVEPVPVPQITNGPRIFSHQDFVHASNPINPLVVLQEQDVPTERLMEKTCDAVELRPAIADVPEKFVPIDDLFTGMRDDELECTADKLPSDVMSTAVTVPRLFLSPGNPKQIGTFRYDQSSLKSEKSRQSEEPLRIPPSHEPLRFSIENETELTELRPHISVWKANTTYLLCGKVSQIHPANGTLFTNTDETQSTMITFYIPPDKSSTDKLFLAVTCKVIETAYIPPTTVEISEQPSFLY
jgi:hypothetical protein